MDTKNINLMNDALFKAFMCHENTRELVIDFLHSVTSISKELLRKGIFIGGEELPKRKTYNKKQMTDMSILYEGKRRIIVEMNQYNTKNLLDKNASYAFSVLVESTPRKVKEYPKVLLISIDNINVFKTNKPILHFKIQEESGLVETDMYESIHLILANIENPKYNIDKEIKKFASFLKETNLEEMGNLYKGDERYMAAVRTVEDLTTDESLIGYYNYEEERERELEEEKEYAREIGYKEGHEEGHKAGRKEGREEGREEGILQNAIETAKNLLTMGVLSIEQIANATHLSIEQIISLKEK